MKADRISGLAVLLAGLAMIFAIIPAYVETAEDGVIQPATLPYALCCLITACGAWLVVRPGDTSPPPAHELRRAAMHAGLLAGGVAAMAGRVSSPKVKGTAIAIAITGPIPGTTPTNWPTRTPKTTKRS